jgi:hypothetical protein
MYLSAEIYLYPLRNPLEELDDQEFAAELTHESDSDEEEIAAESVHESIQEPNQKGLLFHLGARCPHQESNINAFYQTVPEHKVLPRPEFVF